MGTEHELTELEEAQATISHMREFIRAFATVQHTAHHKNGQRFDDCPMIGCHNVRRLLDETAPHAGPRPINVTTPAGEPMAARLALVLTRAPLAGPTEAMLVPVSSMSRAKAYLPTYLNRGWEQGWPVTLVGPGKS